MLVHYIVAVVAQTSLGKVQMAITSDHAHVYFKKFISFYDDMR